MGFWIIRNKKTGNVATQEDVRERAGNLFIATENYAALAFEFFSQFEWELEHYPKSEQKERLYYPPIGTEQERTSNKTWPGKWIDANPYLRWYKLPSHWAYHTGADLNLNEPAFDSDAHAPVYSIGDGKVYAVRQFSGWDWIVCIEHEHCLSRYAHLENIQVKEGDEVTWQSQIANIGNAGGNYPYHLHFDVARPSARMKNYPGDWPRDDKERVLKDYYDPLKWLKEWI